jgi:hypothetical protein
VDLFDSPENAQQVWGKLKPVLQRLLDAVELQLTALFDGRTETGLPRPQLGVLGPALHVAPWG